MKLIQRYHWLLLNGDGVLANKLLFALTAPTTRQTRWPEGVTASVSPSRGSQTMAADVAGVMGTNLASRGVFSAGMRSDDTANGDRRNDGQLGKDAELLFTLLFMLLGVNVEEEATRFTDAGRVSGEQRGTNAMLSADIGEPAGTVLGDSRAGALADDNRLSAGNKETLVVSKVGADVGERAGARNSDCGEGDVDRDDDGEAD
jgi:hypothetical protein